MRTTKSLPSRVSNGAKPPLFIDCSGEAVCDCSLAGDLQDVTERVATEPCHRSDIGGEHVAVPRVQVLDELIDSLLDELQCGVFGLRGALLIGRVATLGLRRIFPMRRGVCHCWRCWRCCLWWLPPDERLGEAGVNWKVYQQEDNYGCNLLEPSRHSRTRRTVRLFMSKGCCVARKASLNTTP